MSGVADMLAPSSHRALTGHVVATFLTKFLTLTRNSYQAAELGTIARLTESRPVVLQLEAGRANHGTIRMLWSMLKAVVARTAGLESAMVAATDGNPSSVAAELSTEEHLSEGISNALWMLRPFCRPECLTN
jgi:ornithine carbamoyltransferase